MPKYNYRHKEDIEFGKKKELEILSELNLNTSSLIIRNRNEN